jgi:hypothetical protein
LTRQHDHHSVLFFRHLLALRLAVRHKENGRAARSSRDCSTARRGWQRSPGGRKGTFCGRPQSRCRESRVDRQAAPGLCR